jgi:23S rRNA (guanosine2251-2'-O)-methyltransferase
MEIVVIAHNIRSTHNVGSILRTADGFGIHKVFLTGYTPYPTQANDTRLPHMRDKITKQIHKTALGAELSVANEYFDDAAAVITSLRNDGFYIAALEQSPKSVMLPDFKPTTPKLALLLGEEVHGIEGHLQAMCDAILEIPMSGAKESFNVSVATGIALYELSTSQR